MRRSIKMIRNIFLALIAATILLAAILAFNTFTHRSRQLQVAAIPRAEVDAQGAARRLAEAIRFKTVSSYEKPDQHADPLRGMQAHLEKSFPAFHAAAKREIVADYSLLYTWQGSDPKAPPIALLAHQDVVPVAPGTEKDWLQPPYDGVIADGFIWGRGSWDDKGNLYSMLEAAEALAKAGFRPKRTIYFAFGHDGNRGHQGRQKHRGAIGLARGQARFRHRRGARCRRHDQGPRQAGRADRPCRKGLCDAGAERGGQPRSFLDAAARDRDWHDGGGAGAAGGPSPADAGPRHGGLICSTRWPRR
jgi:carboxypeptidase PM20D1